jgi:hypothetical protein
VLRATSSSLVWTLPITSATKMDPGKSQTCLQSRQCRTQWDIIETSRSNNSFSTQRRPHFWPLPLIFLSQRNGSKPCKSHQKLSKPFNTVVKVRCQWKIGVKSGQRWKSHLESATTITWGRWTIIAMSTILGLAWKGEAVLDTVLSNQTYNDSSSQEQLITSRAWQHAWPISKSIQS